LAPPSLIDQKNEKLPTPYLKRIKKSESRNKPVFFRFRNVFRKKRLFLKLPVDEREAWDKITPVLSIRSLKD